MISERLTLARAVKRIAHLEERLSAYEGRTTSEAGRSPQLPSRPDRRIRNIDEEADMEQLLRGINHLNVTTRNPEFYGGSCPDAIVNTIETSEVFQPPAEAEPEDRSEAWRLCGSLNLWTAKAPVGVLPPRLCTDQYVHTYFQTAHRLYPILNEQTFMERYVNFWAGKPTEGKGYELWTAVMYMVFAIGHQCSTAHLDSTTKQNPETSQHGAACFALAKTTFADVPFSGGDLSAVNSMFLAFVWLYNQQKLHEAYAMLGAATRAGYSIGLHRELLDPSFSSAEVQGWTATWWNLFIYETELASVLGRPCSIQPREVDVQQFPLDTSPVHLQYVERMRQFMRLTWDAYEAVYSLTFKNTTVTEREAALARSDRTICMWYDSWYPHCLWAREPHGLIFHTRYFNIRILLYRAFLKLLVQKGRRQEDINNDVLKPASKCVDLARTLVQITTSIDFERSGTLQAALFHANTYLWNATISLLLYITDKHAPGRLPRDRADIIAHVNLAIRFFSAHQDRIPFARVAEQKSKGLLAKVVLPQDHRDGAANLPLPATPVDQTAQHGSPNEILGFLSGFDVPAFYPDAYHLYDLDNGSEPFSMFEDFGMAGAAEDLQWDPTTTSTYPWMPPEAE